MLCRTRPTHWQGIRNAHRGPTPEQPKPMALLDFPERGSRQHFDDTGGNGRSGPCTRMAGWPRVLPPGAPTDPDVRTLAHPVPLMLGSPCSQALHARIAILGRDGDTCFQVQSLGRISRPRVQHQAPPFGFSFLPPGPAGPVPRLHQYYEGAATSCRPFRRTSFPSFGGTSLALVIFAPRRTSAPSRPGVGHPVPPAGIRRGDDRISQVPGEPQLSVCTCSTPTPAGLLAPDHTVQQRGPWSSKGKGSHEGSFGAQ